MWHPRRRYAARRQPQGGRARSTCFEETPCTREQCRLPEDDQEGVKNARDGFRRIPCRRRYRGSPLHDAAPYKSRLPDWPHPLLGARAAAAPDHPGGERERLGEDVGKGTAESPTGFSAVPGGKTVAERPPDAEGDRQPLRGYAVVDDEGGVEQRAVPARAGPQPEVGILPRHIPAGEAGRALAES